MESMSDLRTSCDVEPHLSGTLCVLEVSSWLKAQAMPFLQIPCAKNMHGFDLLDAIWESA